MSVPGGLVACFSYLAAASLWQVDRFPKANHGAEICAVEESIAADGPMVAAVLAALGQPSLLLANNVGDDRAGDHVRGWLRRHGVQTTAEAESGHPTSQITVIGDSHHTRTMFPYLPGITEELERVDLTPLASAAFAYIDGYELIGKAATRAIRAAREAGVSLLLNLGGDQAPSNVLEAADGYPGLVVQTSIAEESLDTAAQLAACIQTNMQPEWTVVTAGAAGTAAAGRRQVIRVPAFPAAVRHTHCAGAAFSGGLAYGLLHGWPTRDSLVLASASGTMRCERTQDEPMPTLDELRGFIRSRQGAMSAV